MRRYLHPCYCFVSGTFHDVQWWQKCNFVWWGALFRFCCRCRVHEKPGVCHWCHTDELVHHLSVRPHYSCVNFSHWTVHVLVHPLLRVSLPLWNCRHSHANAHSYISKEALLWSKYTSILLFLREYLWVWWNKLRSLRSSFPFLRCIALLFEHYNDNASPCSWSKHILRFRTLEDWAGSTHITPTIVLKTK